MFNRNIYIDQLQEEQQNKIIRVLVGVRRSGKTILLEQYRAFLRRQEIKNGQIQVINFNRLTDPHLLDPAFLYQRIKKKLIKGKQNYFFLDELEAIGDFLPLVSKLHVIDNLTIFITGSTAATLAALAPIKDRCRIIPVLPLTFSEYLECHHEQPSFQRLYQYLNQGGFPFSQGLYSQASQRNYTEEVFNTIIMTALMKQAGKCQPAIVTQLAGLLIRQLGNPLNVSQAVAGLATAQTKASNKTVANYLQFLQNTFLFLPCCEFDLAVNKVKPTNTRYYPVDLTIKSFLANQRNVPSKANLETIIFLELVSRGYQVFTTHFKGQAVTFMGVKGHRRHYIQFEYSLNDQEKYQETIHRLQKLPAGGNRTLIFAKEPSFIRQAAPAVQQISLLDWLVPAEKKRAGKQLTR